MSMRILAVGLVVLIYLQPSERVAEVITRKSRVLVFVDESRSMGTSSEKSRAEEVLKFFREQRSWFEELFQKNDVTCYRFSNKARMVPCASLFEDIETYGGATDILGSIKGVLDGISSREIGGILIFSDGLDNKEIRRFFSAHRTLQSKSMLGIPGPIYGFIPKSQPITNNISISYTGGTNYALVRNLQEVEVGVRAVGDIQSQIEVSLFLDGIKVSSTEVSPNEAKLGAVAKLSFLPKGVGKYPIEVRVSADQEEDTYADNIRRDICEVVRDRIRILHVAGHPSWDERFLRAYLKNRKDVELVSFHTLRASDSMLSASDDETTLIPFPAEDIFIKYVESFDLIILQDYELPNFDIERFSRSIEKYLTGGGGLLFLGGSYSLGARGLWPSHLNNILPILPPKLTGSGMIEGNIDVLLTEEGRRHPIFAEPRILGLLEHPLQVRSLQLTGGTKEDAITLLQAQSSNILENNRLPLLVISEKEKGRIAVILTDTIWSWSFTPATTNIYQLLFDAIIDYLSHDNKTSAISVKAIKRNHILQDDVKVLVTASLGIDKVILEVLAGEQSIETREVTIGETGRALVNLHPPKEGFYKIIARARDLEVTDVFMVGPTWEEVNELMPTTKYLDALVRMVGGRVFELDNPNLEEIKIRPEVTTTTGIISDVPIWSHPIFLILLILVLGIEWYMERKIEYT